MPTGDQNSPNESKYIARSGLTAVHRFSLSVGSREAASLPLEIKSNKKTGRGANGKLKGFYLFFSATDKETTCTPRGTVHILSMASSMVGSFLSLLRRI